MLKLLDEKQIVPAVQKLTTTSKDMRIAVAFWGVGGAKKLGLKRGKKVKVICNLESGATNPEAISELKSLGVTVKTNPRLHAKVYCGDTQVILGSSNASTNGLAMGENDSRGWLEANVISDDEAIVEDVREWFSKLWKAQGTKAVSKDELEKAQIEWDKRRRQEALREFKGSLLDAVRKYPTLFKHVYFAIYEYDLSQDAKEAYGALQRNGLSRSKAGISHKTRIAPNHAYENFDLPKEGQFVGFDLRTRGKPQFRYGSKPISTTTFGSSDDTLHVVLNQRGILLPQFNKPLRLSKNEEKLIIEIQKYLVRMGKGNRPLPIKKVVEYLGKR